MSYDWLYLQFTVTQQVCHRQKKCSKVAKLQEKCALLWQLFFSSWVYFVRLLVVEIWSILYMVISDKNDNISKTKSRTRKTQCLYFLEIWPLLNKIKCHCFDAGMLIYMLVLLLLLFCFSDTGMASVWLHQAFPTSSETNVRQTTYSRLPYSGILTKSNYRAFLRFSLHSIRHNFDMNKHLKKWKVR